MKQLDVGYLKWIPAELKQCSSLQTEQTETLQNSGQLDTEQWTISHMYTRHCNIIIISIIERFNVA